MFTATVTIDLKGSDREMLSYSQYRGGYELKTDEAIYEVRDCDEDIVSEFLDEESNRVEIQVYVICEPFDLSYDLSLEAGHDTENRLVLDGIKIDNIELNTDDEFISENGEIETRENSKLIGDIVNYLNSKLGQ